MNVELMAAFLLGAMCGTIGCFLYLGITQARHLRRNLDLLDELHRSKK